MSSKDPRFEWLASDMEGNGAETYLSRGELSA